MKIQNRIASKYKEINLSNKWPVMVDKWNNTDWKSQIKRNNQFNLKFKLWNSNKKN